MAPLRKMSDVSHIPSQGDMFSYADNTYKIQCHVQCRSSRDQFSSNTIWFC